MLPPTTWLMQEKSTSVSLVNQCKVITNQCQPVSSWRSLQRVQKTPFSIDSSRKMEFGCLWLRSRIRAHNKLSEAKQLLGLFDSVGPCFSINFYLPCINPRALICSIRWNQQKPRQAQTCVWTKQDFPSSLKARVKRINLLFVVSTVIYGMGKDGQKISGI